MDRVRVATLQYLIRPIQSFDQFREQVKGLIRTAADYGCQLLVFPEYFTIQLITLGDVERPVIDQVRAVADFEADFLEMFSELSKTHGIHVVAGSIPHRVAPNSERITNRAYFFAPDGSYDFQEKLHMTRFEREHWKVDPGKSLRVFDTEFGKVAITICYDVEFPELARRAARHGAQILVVPSFTDDRQAFLRVRYCAQARAVENQMFVIHSGTVGSLPMISAVSLNYGQAAILTPSDFQFARDGILAEGIPNQESMVIGELNLRVLRSARARGTVIPLKDSKHSDALASTIESVTLMPQSPSAKTAPSTKRRSIVVRNTRPDDFRGIRQMAQLIYPDIEPWSSEQLQKHLDMFPQGQFVAIEKHSGLVVGMCSGLIINWDSYEADMDWSRFTDGGAYTNHDPVEGGTLYAADVMVRPGMQGHGIGKRLYAHGRFGLARQIGMRRILAGSRLRGYSIFASKMSAEEYVVEVAHGRLNDPTLSFQIAQGFHVLAVKANYFRGDEASQGNAAVIEWLNPDVASPEDYLQGEDRYRPPGTRGPSEEKHAKGNGE